MLISASDDKTKQSADEFLRKIQDGEFSIIGENAFFKGVNMQTAPTTNSVYITQLIELIQYYKASMYNELGLNANYNMKRERLNLGEVSMNVDVLLPYVDNMLKERQNAVEKINAMFDTEISVKLASSWGLERDNYNALAADLETAKENPTLQTNPTRQRKTPKQTETTPKQTETTRKQRKQRKRKKRKRKRTVTIPKQRKQRKQKKQKKTKSISNEIQRTIYKG
jgi:hypothetical protein